MILDFNHQYIHNFDDFEIDEDFKKPEYLHIVITCQDQEQGNVKQTDLDVLHTQMLDQMQNEIPRAKRSSSYITGSKKK